MFRFLDAKKLNSDRQNAHIFFYPGADATQMYDRLISDPKYKVLNIQSVQKVVVLTGSNNVDSIYNGRKS